MNKAESYAAAEGEAVRPPRRIIKTIEMAEFALRHDIPFDKVFSVLPDHGSGCGHPGLPPAPEKVHA